MWSTEEQKTLPSSGTILADTGELTEQSDFNFTAVLSTTVAASVKIQWRNGANDENVKEQIINLVAGASVNIDGQASLIVSSTERFRIVTSGAILGSIQASIFHDGIPL